MIAAGFTGLLIVLGWYALILDYEYLEETCQ